MRDEGIRLAKRVAAQLGCSRATSEAHIAGGWVQVDGVVVDRPEARVREDQQVVVDRNADLTQLAPVTLVLHQPPGLARRGVEALLVSAHRWTEDPMRSPLLPVHRRDLEPLLPIPPACEGLAVFSQVAGVQRRLLDRQTPIEQEWVLDLAAEPTPAAVDALAQATSGRVSRQSELALRLVFKRFDALELPQAAAWAGFKPQRLRRLRLGRLGLAGLPAGAWRRLGLGERF